MTAYNLIFGAFSGLHRAGRSHCALLHYYPLYLFDTDLTFVPDFVSGEAPNPLTLLSTRIGFYEFSMELDTNFFLKPANPNTAREFHSFVSKNNGIFRELPFFSKSLFLTFDVISADQESSIETSLDLLTFDVRAPDDDKGYWVSVRLKARLSLAASSSSVDVSAQFFSGHVVFVFQYYDYEFNSYEEVESPEYGIAKLSVPKVSQGNYVPNFNFWKSKHKKMGFRSVLLPQTIWVNFHADLQAHTMKVAFQFSQNESFDWQFDLNPNYQNEAELYHMSVMLKLKDMESYYEHFFQKSPLILRLFELFIFDGGYLGTKTVDVGSSNEKTMIYAKTLKEDSAQTDILLSTSSLRRGPFRRVEFADQVSSFDNPGALTFEHVRLNLVSDEEVTQIHTPNCVSETRAGRCLQCDVLYELDMAMNTCVKCTSFYLNFLSICTDKSSSLNAVTLNQNAGFDWYPTEFGVSRVQNGITVTEKYKYIIKTDFTNVFENMFYFANYFQKSESRSVLVYQVKARHLHSRPPLFFFFFCQRIDVYSTNYLHDTDFEIWDYDSQKKQFEYGISTYNALSYPTFHIDGLSNNIAFAYKTKDQDGNLTGIEFDSNSLKEKFREYTFQEILELVNLQKFGSRVTPSVSFHPAFDSNLVYIRRGPFYYELGQLDQITNNMSSSFIGGQWYLNIQYPCSSSCSKCTNSTTCLECEPGFFQIDGNCMACNPQCETCTGTVSNCVTCSSTNGTFTLFITRRQQSP